MFSSRACQTLNAARLRCREPIYYWRDKRTVKKVYIRKTYVKRIMQVLYVRTYGVDIYEYCTVLLKALYVAYIYVIEKSASLWVRKTSYVCTHAESGTL